MAAPSPLTRTIEALLAASKAHDAEASPKLRREMLEQAQAIRYALTTPQEALMQQLTNYTETAAMRALWQLGILKQMPPKGSISAVDLAVKTGVDEEVLRRLMRMVSATGALEVQSEDAFCHTANSLIYLEGAEIQFWDLCVDEVMPVAFDMAKYLGTHAGQAFLNPRKSPYAWYHQAEGKTFYEFLLDEPQRLKRFNTAMTTEENALPVLKMFPFVALVTNVPIDPSRAFFVDVAGGRGQSLLQIKRELESVEGGPEVAKRKFILQDWQRVLDAIPDGELPGVDKMAIDFFRDQPVKGANIYYLRRIMHNWQDAECITILKHIADAMALDSRLLIGDMVVPEKPVGIDKTVYWMDLCMLVIGGKERTAHEFRDILGPAGLELVKVWPMEGSSQTVIECHLARQ